jgi:hypothetical protein
MRRREFTTLLGGAAVWPLGDPHSSRQMPVVGLISTTSHDDFGGVR